MNRDGNALIRFRQLGPSDRTAIAGLAAAAFDGNRFYQNALGLDARRFALYWDAFFHLALRDSAAAVYGLEQNGRLEAAAAVAFDGFPRASRGARYLLTLLRRLGFRAWLRYLRFVRAYERVMRRPAPERQLEACGLWLFVRPDAASAGLGSRLARDSIEAVRARGKLLITGLVDASNRPLLSFYHRLAFAVTPPFPFAGMPAAVIERWLVSRDAPLEALKEGAPCSS
ncbi:MAG: GNAT family N-acetyltransferase [Gemmatimonadota bacterium]|nr:MAG: GNAT family N-acetyltransferase [Gemmatimonadota bacterium]